MAATLLQPLRWDSTTSHRKTQELTSAEKTSSWSLFSLSDKDQWSLTLKIKKLATTEFKSTGRPILLACSVTTTSTIRQIFVSSGRIAPVDPSIPYIPISGIPKRNTDTKASPIDWLYLMLKNLPTKSLPVDWYISVLSVEDMFPWEKSLKPLSSKLDICILKWKICIAAPIGSML